MSMPTAEELDELITDQMDKERKQAILAIEIEKKVKDQQKGCDSN